MTLIVCIALGVYLLVGVYLASKGPLGIWIDQRLEETRFNCGIDAWVAHDNGEPRRLPSDARLRVLGVTFRALAVLAWPLLLPGAFSQENLVMTVAASIDHPLTPESEPAPVPSVQVERNALYFKWLSGAGQISCLDCNFRDRLTGTLHFRSSTSVDGTVMYLGHQCRNCRKFCEVVIRDGVTSDLHCDCGGDLARDEVLLCPACAGNNLSYQCLAVT